METPLLDLAELQKSWDLALRSEGKAPGTLRLYATGIKAFLTWCETTGTPPELTKPAVRGFVADLLAGGAQPATAIARQKAVRQFSAWLTTEGELADDPLLGLKRPTEVTKVVEALDDDQLRRLFAACKGKTFTHRRDEALVRFMAETGARAEEVIGLAVADVDLPRGLAIVRKGKGGKGRMVPFGPQTAAAIDRYLRMRKTHPLAGTPALWLGAQGRTFGYHGLDEALKVRAKAAGIEKFHAHLLRHTAATRWLRAGGSEQGLMAVAGWANRQMMDRYTNASASNRAADESRLLNLGDL